MSGAAATAAGARRPTQGLWERLGKVNPRYLIIFLVTLILALGEWRYSILGGYERLATTLGLCVILEAVLSTAIRGKMANLASAYVSGISLSLLTKPQADLLWPFAMGAFLAIASKYVITYRGRHLYNPSNLAISVMVLLAPGSVSILSHQWGNDLATNAVIWFFGLVIVSRARVLHITAAYVISFMVFAVLRTAISGDPLLAEIAPLTGPMYQLFIFFMVTDPRTTVSTKTGRIVVVVLVALAEALIRIAGDLGISALTPLYYSPPILALFLVGPVAMLWDLRRRAVSEAT